MLRRLTLNPQCETRPLAEPPEEPAKAKPTESPLDGKEIKPMVLKETSSDVHWKGLMLDKLQYFDQLM